MSQEKTISDTKLFRPGTYSLQPSKIITNHASSVPLKERTHLYQLDNFEYDRDGSNPGKIIIFNEEFGDDLSMNREGSRRDVNEIILCFQRLGFNILEEDVLVDQTAEQIFNKLDSVVKDEASLKEANCLIIFFLTHGEPNNELCVKGGTINCTEIWAKFRKCPNLNRKPKMFVFQACKGEYYTTTDGKTEPNAIHKDSSQLLDMDGFTVTQLANDMLILFSSIEGNKSYRHVITGSWLIQELCKNFSMYGRRDDVVSLILRTIKCICGNYFHHQPGNEIYQKQMPIFVSTLTKKFYLNRNKDRNLLLEINRKQDELLDLVNKIGEFSKQQHTGKKL